MCRYHNECLGDRTERCDYNVVYVFGRWYGEECTGLAEYVEVGEESHNGEQISKSCSRIPVPDGTSGELPVPPLRARLSVFVSTARYLEAQILCD